MTPSLALIFTCAPRRLCCCCCAESLLRQQPGSIMALIWCVEYGVLPKEEADTMYPKYLEAKAEVRRRDVKRKGEPGLCKPSQAKPSANIKRVVLFLGRTNTHT